MLFHKKKLEEIEKKPGIDFVAVTYGAGDQIPYMEQAKYVEFHVFKQGKPMGRQLLSASSMTTEETILQLLAMGMNRLICRGCGSRTAHELKKRGVHLYYYDGGAGAAIRAWRKGELKEDEGRR